MSRAIGRAVALALLAAAGCVSSELVECGDRLCPLGDVCSPSGDRCVSPAQFAACAGIAEGADCTVDGAQGRCTAGLCDTGATRSFRLHVSLRGGGAGRVVSAPEAIDCGPTCEATLPQGASLTLTARPSAGSTFAGWSGPCTGLEPCVLTVTAETTVSASFLPPPAPKIDEVEPSGGTGVGGAVTILGSDFTGATAVIFNGVSQPLFTVVSPTRIETTVPAGARSGPVMVVTAGGETTSRQFFPVVLADIAAVDVEDSGGCVSVFMWVTQERSLPANIRVEFDAGAGYQRATPSPGQSLIGVNTSPEGIQHVFSWDSTHDLPHATIAGVKLRVTATVANVSGSAGRSGARTLTVRNGPLLAVNGDLTVDATGWWTRGDVNGDGVADLIVGTSRGASRLLGGRGAFGEPTPLFDGPQLLGRLADLDRDGVLELLTVGADGALVVRRPAGDGTFLAPGPPLAEGVTWFEPVDVDRDGVVDVLFDGAWAHGNGDGTFRAAIPEAPIPRGARPLLADVDRDGAPDLLVLSSETSATAVLGRDGGDFGLGPSSPLPIPGGRLALGDLDGDGVLDLAVASASRGAILRGAGDGSFGDETPFLDWSSVVALRIADLGRDGKPDVVVLARAQRPAILVAGGDGRLQGSFVLPDVTDPLDMAIDDLDRDGAPEVILLHNRGVRVFQNLTQLVCSVSLAGPARVALGGELRAVASGDLDRDGAPDLAVLRGDDAVAILLGGGDGSFTSGPEVPVGGRSLVAADLDRDGKLDLVVATAAGSVAVLYGRGDGSFEAPLAVPLPGGPQRTIVADVDGDSHLDLVAASAGLALANGRRSFMPFAPIGLGPAIAAADLDGDGRADLVGTAGPGRLGVLLGRVTPREPTTFDVPLSPEDVMLGDSNGDLRPDLLLTTTVPGEVLALLSRGGGLFARTPERVNPDDPPSLLVGVGDLDGDARPDRVTSYLPLAGSVLVAPGNVAGSFDPARLVTSGRSGDARMVLVDLDRDGLPDLVGAGDDGQVSVWLAR